ncbi:hypothetical protein HNQ07_003687 [Deinococcus metalli]|uniref:Uncharacterized protein n=1 Tax=Deinococcus metalli TaxID=1141878 RepID=A0A7W8NQS7_9DEIO|nr:hypothetical protein [Deinococcus metalli]MBB5378186.1 hypothetical protein [Deinococcus metalli]GHF56675.1 hypothetical protein GCM10017781_36250 [Deinococcus metalli]
MAPDPTTPDDRDPLPVNPTLMPHHAPAPEHGSADQGPIPDHLPDAPAMLPTSTEGLSSQEVTDLVGGGDASIVEANEALEQAEGVDPVTES